jgi:hypothetical protein
MKFSGRTNRLDFRQLRLGTLFSEVRGVATALTLCAFLALTGSAIWAMYDSSAQAEPTTLVPEYQVKSAFLFNFIKFVEWPGNGAQGASVPFSIGILGKDPFGKALQAVEGKVIRGRSVEIRRSRRIEELSECKVLFISASERGRLPQILKQLQKSDMLTVADQEGFCEAGGMINMVTVRNKVGFEINVAAARNVGLRISSQLLKLAQLVIE